MITSTTSATASSTAAVSTTSSALTASTSASAQQANFMTLLVAQLKNQDPMSPMDNAQMTSQIAQINTVSGIQQVNDTLKSMSDQFAATQMLQGSSMVGHSVLLDSNTLTINNGTASGAIDLAGKADSVKVDVLSPAGQVVDSFNLGSLDAGRQDFTWDASKYNYTGDPSFKVTATLAGTAVTSTTMALATVTSVGSENGAMTVQLQGRSPVAYSAVKAIL